MNDTIQKYIAWALEKTINDAIDDVTSWEIYNETWWVVYDAIQSINVDITSDEFYMNYE